MAGASSSRQLIRQLNTLFQCGTVGQLSDAELLARFAAGRDQGAEAAFAALVERHGAMVLGVCRRMLGNWHEAEDAFQATFLVLARKAAAIGQREQLASWLYGVARLTALDARARATRRRANEKRLGSMLPVEQPDQTEIEELRSILDEELARLPERSRAALILCELEGLSRRQAAGRLGITEGTLSSRLARAKEQLRDRLTRRGLTLSAAILAAALTREAHAVLVSPVLVDSTIKGATLVAAGSTLAGVASTSVATLTQGVLKAMLLAKLKLIVLGFASVALVTTGVGVVAQQPVPVTVPVPEQDRLKAVEQKLDRLLEVLSGSRNQSTPTVLPLPDGNSASRTEDVTSAARTSIAPTDPFAPPATTAVVRSADPPVPAVNRANFDRGAEPAVAGTPPSAVGSQSTSLDGRVAVLEQRLSQLERRFGEIERRLDQTRSGVDRRNGANQTSSRRREGSARNGVPSDRSPRASDRQDVDTPDVNDLSQAVSPADEDPEPEPAGARRPSRSPFDLDRAVPAPRSRLTAPSSDAPG